MKKIGNAFPYSYALYTPKASRFVPRKSLRARCAWSSILAQVLNQSVVFPEHRVEALAVFMPHMDKQCAILTPRICRSTPSDNAFGVYGL